MGARRYDIDIWIYTAFRCECFKLPIHENKAKACKASGFYSQRGMFCYSGKLLDNSFGVVVRDLIYDRGSYDLIITFLYNIAHIESKDMLCE